MGHRAQVGLAVALQQHRQQVRHRQGAAVISNRLLRLQLPLHDNDVEHRQVARRSVTPRLAQGPYHAGALRIRPRVRQTGEQELIHRVVLDDRLRMSHMQRVGFAIRQLLVNYCVAGAGAQNRAGDGRDRI